MRLTRFAWLVSLRGRFLFAGLFSPKSIHRFRCNICDRSAAAPLSAVNNRESPSCPHCGSNRRFRSIVAALSGELFGERFALPEFKPSAKICGIGISDDETYARPLRKIFSYRNTYYHKEPRLDLLAVGEESHSSADFIIASDVLEHVPPPVDLAFENLLQMLKPGGVCILSVPYDKEGTTREHYPDLHQFKIVGKKSNRRLVNQTVNGQEQTFDNLIFHGGSGATLELRRFSEPQLLESLRQAGFVDIKIHDKSAPEWGILLEEDEGGLIISMRKKA